MVLPLQPKANEPDSGPMPPVIEKVGPEEPHNEGAVRPPLAAAALVGTSPSRDERVVFAVPRNRGGVSTTCHDSSTVALRVGTKANAFGVWSFRACESSWKLPEVSVG